MFEANKLRAGGMRRSEISNPSHFPTGSQEHHNVQTVSWYLMPEGAVGSSSLSSHITRAMYLHVWSRRVLLKVT